MHGSRKFRRQGRGGGGVVINVLHRGNPIASRGWSVPESLKKPIATCDFPGGGWGGAGWVGGAGPVSSPLDQLMIYILNLYHADCLKY